MIAPISLFRRKKKYIITLCVIYFTLVYPSPLISVFGIPPPFFSSIQSPANQSSRLRKAELEKKERKRGSLQQPRDNLLLLWQHPPPFPPSWYNISLFFFTEYWEERGIPSALRFSIWKRGAKSAGKRLLFTTALLLHYSHILANKRRRND